MVDRTHDLPVSRQAHESGISRGSVYYLPHPASLDDLALMRRIDEMHLEHPFTGTACWVTRWLEKASGWAGCTSRR